MIHTKFQQIVDSEIGSDMLKSEEFYYSKAVAAWLEWKNYAIDPRQAQAFAELPYDQFRSSDNPAIAGIREILFRIVAYCDVKAKDIARLNTYDDRRAVARSGIYQNAWVKQLLRYKINPDQLSPGVRNTIAYLENPAARWPIISENHRQWIINCFGCRNYDPATFDLQLQHLLMPYWSGRNPENATAYLTHCLYAMDTVWKNPAVGGLLVHETSDAWKKDLCDDMGDGCGCIWWNSCPVRFTDEILNSLQAAVEAGDTFDFYYLKNNRAYYKATVVDFALRRDYAEKSGEWEEKSPAGFSRDVDDYCDREGDRKAEMIFLINKFERLDPGIEHASFQLYKGMKYNHQTGIAAYTKILTQAEMKQQETLDACISLLNLNRNLVLTGAPGTGKTYLAHRIADALIGPDGDKEEQLCFVQFHPSYDYTDFVEGLRPKKPRDGSGNIGFELQSGEFKKLCIRALDNLQKSRKTEKNLAADAAAVPLKKFVCIIDEINRGEIAKIFGELFFAIEAGYRYKGEPGEVPHRIKTQYANLEDEGSPFANGLYVPDNVYIVATMNDIDRSVESLDFAVRRRFVWREVTAQESAVSFGLKKEVVERMDRLNRQLHELGFSSAYDVGAAYFKDLDAEACTVDDLWNYRLKTLLSEYLRGWDQVPEKLTALEKAYYYKDPQLSENNQ